MFINTELIIGQTYSESDIYSFVQSIHRNDEDFYEGDIGQRIEEYSNYKVLEIPINTICTDEYELDEDYLQDYILKYKELGTYPPIVLGRLDKEFGYNIIDGNHRVNGLKEIGVETIICFVGIN